MDQPNRTYFQLQQAVEVASVFAKHEAEFMFIGKSGAILLGYPSTTQDVDLFIKKDPENGRRIIAGVRELGFDVSPEIEKQIIAGVDFVQLKSGPFDLDLVFAPDGIESFDKAKQRMHVIEGFPVATSETLSRASENQAGKRIWLTFPY